jgi:hypothetical protein
MCEAVKIGTTFLYGFLMSTEGAVGGAKEEHGFARFLCE